MNIIQSNILLREIYHIFIVNFSKKKRSFFINDLKLNIKNIVKKVSEVVIFVQGGVIL